MIPAAAPPCQPAAAAGAADAGAQRVLAGAPPVDYMREMERHGRAAVATLVLGIAALTFSLLPFLLPLGVLTGAAALITGLLMRRHTLRVNIPEDRKNVAGRWCGLIGLLLSLVTFLLLLVATLGATAA